MVRFSVHESSFIQDCSALQGWHINGPEEHSFSVSINQKTVSTMLISNLYITTGSYFLLNLISAAHFYQHVILFLDKENTECTPSSFPYTYQELRICSCCLHFTKWNMVSPLLNFILAVYFMWLYWTYVFYSKNNMTPLVIFELGKLKIYKPPLKCTWLCYFPHDMVKLLLFPPCSDRCYSFSPNLRTKTHKEQN